MRLTIGMLEAMGLALQEVLAGEGFQGIHEHSKEQKELMRNADRASVWCAQQVQKRILKRDQTKGM